MSGDTDLATLRAALPDRDAIMLAVVPEAAAKLEADRDEAHSALARVEAELSRLREQLEVLAEAQQFPVETVMSWKRQVDDAKRRSASALLLLDPDRQDEPDEENTRRAFEILSGLRPSTLRPDRERAEAAEARCAAMEECDCIPSEFSSKACPKCGRRGVVTETTVHSLMVEIRDEQARCAELEEQLGTPYLRVLDQRNELAERCARLQQALREIEQKPYRAEEVIARLKANGEALAGPDTPADSHPERTA